MSKGKKFLLKSLIILSPLLILFLIYVITDPFKVLYSYHFDNYYNWQPWEVNRELASVGNLKNRLNKKDTPDSYIFGSSRSFAFQCDTWESYLKNARAFHFDAASETLYGVYCKVKYLDEHNIKINNALFCCDARLLSKTQNEYDITHIKHPDISGESGFSYQTNFIKGYFSDFFFLKHIDYLLTGKVRKYMGDIFVIKPGYVKTDAYKNDWHYQKYDSIIKVDSLGYYNVFKKDAFEINPGNPETYGISIKETQIKMLKEMKRIFDKNDTKIKIIICPEYDQKKFNENDLKWMVSIFGGNAVRDFSGKNEINTLKGNFYDGFHVKPYVAQKIMDDIYTK